MILHKTDGKICEKNISLHYLCWERDFSLDDIKASCCAKEVEVS